MSRQSGAGDGPDVVPAEAAPFYEDAFARARSAIERVRTELPYFPSPPLRVQRIGQLDADLLDQELTDLLVQPVKAALRKASPLVEKRHSAEIYMLLRLVLYKFSIYDRGASYGAMLRNLKYRNEWAHKAHTRDAPLQTAQLVLYPIITILLPYVYAKGRVYMGEHHFDQAPRESAEFVVYSLSQHWQRVWNLVSLVNFGLFLWNGKYRTLTDRMLGMRLTYANRALHRNVSFEFLNRQLVWNAFTEFLLFLLPFIKPQKLLRRAAQIPTHPAVLGAVYGALPQGISHRLGLHKDAEDGKVRMHRTKRASVGRYWYIPDECCPLCFERLEREAGVDVDAPVQERPRPAVPSSISIPNADPLHPRKGLVARRQEKNAQDAPDEKAVSDRAAQRAERMAARRAARKSAESTNTQTPRPGLQDTSPHGIKYMDALIATPYKTLPCAQGCQYCYVCIAEKLRDENMEDDLQQDGGWPCLRCGTSVWGAERVQTQ